MPDRRGRAAALALSLCLPILCLLDAVAGRPAHAVEPPPGSRNFTPPGSVPNYFSNESAPFQGGAGARAATPPAGDQFNAGQPAADTAAAPRRRTARAAAAPRGRQLGKLAHGKALSSRQAGSAARAGKTVAARTAAKPASRQSAGSKQVAAAGQPAAARQAAGARQAAAARGKPAAAKAASARPAGAVKHAAARTAR